MTPVPFVLAAALLWAAGAQAGPLRVLVLDKEGQPVPDAVVSLAPASRGAPKPLPMKVTITQQKMRFAPLVSLAGVGAQATFVNNDPWEHHVRGTPAGIQNFDHQDKGGLDLRLGGKAEGKAPQAVDAILDKAGAVLLGCHLHASMRAHIFVSDTPWAAVSGPDGTASFDGVPDGPVRIRVWHADQLLDLAPHEMMLTPAAASATMKLNVVPRRRRV